MGPECASLVHDAGMLLQPSTLLLLLLHGARTALSAVAVPGRAVLSGQRWWLRLHGSVCV